MIDKTLKSIDPSSGETLKTFPVHDRQYVEHALTLSTKAFETYRSTTFKQRAEIVNRCADILENEKDRWGELMALEMGKTKMAAIGEAEKCALNCRYYAEHAERFLANEPAPPDKAGSERFVAFHPLGPILAIMPWNFPFWQLFRFAAPALMAGNTILLKHASNVPQCALALEEIIKRAGAPEGVFQTLLIGSKEVASVLSDPRIKAATLTGSDKAGEDVASNAGKHLKKVVLELGGSDPFIIMPSVDLDHTVKMAIAARTVNNGESCVAAKRFIVHEKIADQFERKFAEGMKALRIGNQLDLKTQIGPLATPAIREGLAKQVDESVKHGAKILTGGRPLPGPGNFYEPTVLTNISKDTPAYYEEFFGPVGLVFRAKDLHEALRMANDNPFGLGASFWSADKTEQEFFVREIEAGMAFVNSQVVSDPPIPFGGVKRSGFGRELSQFGIREFTNIKTVVLAKEHGRAQGHGTE